MPNPYAQAALTYYRRFRSVGRIWVQIGIAVVWLFMVVMFIHRPHETVPIFLMFIGAFPSIAMVFHLKDQFVDARDAFDAQLPPGSCHRDGSGSIDFHGIFSAAAFLAGRIAFRLFSCMFYDNFHRNSFDISRKGFFDGSSSFSPLRTFHIFLIHGSRVHFCQRILFGKA